MEDLYELLQVSKNASPEIIEKAYKTLAKKYHPDVAINKQQAEIMMKKINSAYDILSNPKTKAEYDFNLEQEERKKEIEKEHIKQNITYNQQYNNSNDMYNRQTNMYYNNYNNKYDYANNFDFSHRILNIKWDKTTKILVVIIVLSVILIIGKIVFFIEELFGNTSTTNNTNNNDINVSNNSVQEDNKLEEDKEDKEYYINDIEPFHLVETFIVDFQNLEFDKLNTNMNDNFILSEYVINELNKKEEYKYIIENSVYTIQDYSVTNKKAEITIGIKRINVEQAVYDYSLYYWEALLGGGNLSNKVIDFLEKYKEDVIEKNTVVIVENVNDEWKINFSNSNFSQMLGVSIGEFF